MGKYELDQGESFIIETLREFHFLWGFDYVPSELALFQCRNEYSVTFYNRFLSRRIEIEQYEDFGLHVIFKQETKFGTKITELNKIAKFESEPTSLKTLANIVKSDYMYLVNPQKESVLPENTSKKHCFYFEGFIKNIVALWQDKKGKH